MAKAPPHSSPGAEPVEGTANAPPGVALAEEAEAEEFAEGGGGIIASCRKRSLSGVSPQ